MRVLAEREGFEPPIGLHLCRISSAVHSTTLPPLQGTPVGRTLRAVPNLVPCSIAFSSVVYSGSREENASKYQARTTDQTRRGPREMRAPTDRGFWIEAKVGPPDAKHWRSQPSLEMLAGKRGLGRSTETAARRVATASGAATQCQS